MELKNIRLSVPEIDIEDPRIGRVGISLSIGIAGCCAATDDIDTLIKRADTALYASKRNGRNMVSTISV